LNRIIIIRQTKMKIGAAATIVDWPDDIFIVQKKTFKRTKKIRIKKETTRQKVISRSSKSFMFTYEKVHGYTHIWIKYMHARVLITSNERFFFWLQRRVQFPSYTSLDFTWYTSTLINVTKDNEQTEAAAI